MHGVNISKRVIGDTDGLIAMMSQEDALFEKATSTIKFLIENDYQIFFPVTTIAETVTTLKRKFNQSDLAASVISQIENNIFFVEAVTQETLQESFAIFNPNASKQNTLFDAINVAVARRNNIDIIFSFDLWYEKLGLTMAYKLLS